MRYTTHSLNQANLQPTNPSCHPLTLAGAKKCSSSSREYRSRGWRTKNTHLGRSDHLHHIARGPNPMTPVQAVAPSPFNILAASVRVVLSSCNISTACHSAQLVGGPGLGERGGGGCWGGGGGGKCMCCCYSRAGEESSGHHSKYN